MSVREAVREKLATDPTLQALLTGGVWAVREITRQETPGAFDESGEVRACALVKMENETQTGPYQEVGAVSSRTYVVVYFYQWRGYETIDEAMARAAAVLHRGSLGESGVWEVAWADDVTDQEDVALGCSLGMSRYAVTRLRS